jgi:mycoredoxin
VAETTAPSGGAPAVTMYTTTWCGYCKRLKRMMQDDGINFVEVDIEQTPGTAEIVEKVNNGNQTVPTLVFSDGSAMTNPSLAKVKEKLAALAG